MHTAAP